MKELCHLILSLMALFFVLEIKNKVGLILTFTVWLLCSLVTFPVEFREKFSSRFGIGKKREK